MSLKTIQLSEEKVENLLVFLERLVCHEGDQKFPPRFTSDFVREGVTQMMAEVTKQTGVELDSPDFIPALAPGEKNCAHLFSGRDVCALCGVPKTNT